MSRSSDSGFSKAVARKKRTQSGAAILAVTGLLSAYAQMMRTPAAYAASGCSNTAPAIGELVTCTVAGLENLTIPAGAATATVSVTGGAGGGSVLSYGSSFGAAYGQDGGQATGTILLPTGASTVTVSVGQGGAGGSTQNAGSGFGTDGQDSSITIGSTQVVTAPGGRAQLSSNPPIVDDCTLDAVLAASVTCWDRSGHSAAVGGGSSSLLTGTDKILNQSGYYHEGTYYPATYVPGDYVAGYYKYGDPYSYYFCTDYSYYTCYSGYWGTKNYPGYFVDPKGSFGYTIPASTGPGYYVPPTYNYIPWAANDSVAGADGVVTIKFNAPADSATPVVTTDPANATVFGGDTATFTVTASPVTDYQWQLSTDSGQTWTDIVGANSASYTTGAVSPADAAKLFRAKVTNAEVGKTPKDAYSGAAQIFIISHTPVVSTDPADATKNVGETATFSVSASPAQGYQWQVSTDGGTSWTAISGANSSSYTTPSLVYSQNANKYRVFIFNSSNGAPAALTISGAATLTVLGTSATPVITSNPQDANVYPGDTATFSVSATPATSYQWQVSTDGGITWSDVSGANSSSYTTGAIHGLDGNLRYRAKVTNQPTGNSAVSVYSSSAAVWPHSHTPVILTNPSDQAKLVGETATFTGSASPSDQYRWLKSTDGGTTWTEISGATGASYTTPVLTLGDSGTKYKFIASYSEDSAPAASSTSTVATLTVTSGVSGTPIISTNPADQSKNTGDTATFSVVALPATGYQWQVSTDGGTNWSDISGATSASYTTSALLIGDNGKKFRVVVTNTDAGRDPMSVTSTAALLSVTQSVSVTPIIFTNPTDQSKLSGQTATFSVVAIPSTGYQWQVSTNGGSSWSDIASATSAVYTTGTLSVSDSGNKYRVVVTNAEAGKTSSSATSAAANLTVADSNSVTPVVSANPADQIKNTGQTATFSVTASPATGYQWQVSTDGGTTWNDISGATNSSYTTGTLVLADSSKKFHVVVTNAEAGKTPSSVTSSAALLTVLQLYSVTPIITSNPGNQSKNTGQTATFSVTAIPVTGYQWQVSADGGTNWSDISGATSSSYTTASLVLGDNAKKFRVVVTNAEPNAVSQSVTSTSALLTVTAAVSATPVISSNPGNQSKNTGQTATFSVTAIPVTGYQWQVSTDGGTNWSDISGATSSSYTTASLVLGDNAKKFRVVVTNAEAGKTAATATSSAALLTVFQAPVPSDNGVKAEGVGTTKYPGALGKATWSFEINPIGTRAGRGQFTWTLDSKWKYTATVTTFAVNGSVATVFTTGTLSYLSRGKWIAVGSSVVATLTFTASSKSPMRTGTFGISFAFTPSGVQPALPPGTPTNLYSGSISFQ